MSDDGSETLPGTLPPVSVRRAEVRLVRLPLVEPFRSSHGTVADRDLVVLRIETEGGGVGWGECSALPSPTYTGEWAEGAALLLRRRLVPHLLRAGPVTPAALPEALGRVRGNPMAVAAVEMALIDASLREDGRSLAAWLGVARRSIEVGVVVGIGTAPEVTCDTVAARIAEGYTRIKLKIAPGSDVSVVAAVRDRFGPDLPLAVDANGAYTLDDTALLQRLDGFDLTYIEQPLAPEHLEGHAGLAARIATPIALDESVPDLAAAHRAVTGGACAVINAKPARLGGIGPALALHERAAEWGVDLFCGGMLESGLGRAAALAVAALPGFSLPPDLSASDRYFPADLTEPFRLAPGGRLDVPDGPGLGVEPDADRLEATTVATWAVG